MVLIAADKHLSARPNRNPNKNQNHPNERPVANTPAPLSARQSPVGTPQRLLRHPAGDIVPDTSLTTSLVSCRTPQRLQSDWIRG
jgi:hypothetical protein